MIAKRLLKKADWTKKLIKNQYYCDREWGKNKTLKRSKFNSLTECFNYYKKLNVKLNEFKVIQVGDTVIVRNYYNGQFAWLCEFIEITEGEFYEEICEES